MTGWREELSKWPLTPEMQAKVDALFEEDDQDADEPIDLELTPMAYAVAMIDSDD